MSATTGGTDTATRSGSSSGPDRIAIARLAMPRALALEGLLADGQAVCPACGTATRGKTKVFDDGGFHCYRCGHHVGNAIDLLVERGWDLKNAIRALNGDESAIPEDRRGIELPKIEITESFTATPDVEVYEAVLDTGSVDAAVEFYRRWHIDADVVAESRAVVVTSAKDLARRLVSDFGPERLIASGIASEKGKLLIDNRYPVIEPHLLPLEGSPVSAMQFRASQDTEARIAEHKAYKAAKDEAEAAGRPYRGPKAPYVPKFMSLRGAPLTARCGFGLPRLAEVAAEVDAGASPRKVYLVEGFKDMLAARTLGLEVYGLAGAGLLPVRAVCDILRRIGPVAVALDGDDAGADGRGRLLAHLAAHDVEAFEKVPPPGMDMTDVLVAKREGRELPTR